jgi:hypothetical protein
MMLRISIVLHHVFAEDFLQQSINFFDAFKVLDVFFSLLTFRLEVLLTGFLWGKAVQVSTGCPRMSLTKVPKRGV